jgi:hypothetical protein
MENMIVIKINASDVAALIGENPYKSRNEIFEKLAIDNNLLESEITTFVSDMLEQVQPTIKSVCEASSFKEMEQTITIAEDKIKTIAIKDVILKQLGRPTILNEVIDVHQDVKVHIDKEIEKNTINGSTNFNSLISILKNDTKMKEIISENVLVKQACQAVVIERGNILEDKSTNNFEKETGLIVSNRNTKCYIYENKEHGFKIAGRPDGIIEGKTITETKTRRRFWKTTPKYDIIQLKCYMKILNMEMGYLNEQFPDGSSRITNITFDSTDWKKIESDIIEAIKQFRLLYIKNY